MDQSTGELIERLSRLESQQAKLQRSNKHLRMMTGAMLLLCGALFTMAQTSTVTETVEAQQFLLRDSTRQVARLDGRFVRRRSRAESFRPQRPHANNR